MARDLGLPQENVRVVCQYMGGNFGNKNQNQDADLIAAVLAREAGAPVKLELSRKEDFIGMHGRWPTVQYYKVGVTRDGTLQRHSTARLQRHGPLSQELRRDRRHRTVPVPEHRDRRVSRLHEPDRVGKLPRAGVSAGLLRHPVDDGRRRGQAEDGSGRVHPEEHDAEGAATRRRTPTTRSRSASAAAPRCSSGRGAGVRSRIGPRTRSSAAPGVAFMVFRAGLGRSSAVVRVDAKGRYAVHVGVTDVGGGAKTTMGMIAAEALGVPLSQVDVVWGDTDRCPYSVGESGSRTTIMTGYAVVEAVRDLQKQIAEKGMPTGDEVRIGSATPSPTVHGQGAQHLRRAFRGGRGRHPARPRSCPQVRGRPRLRPDHQPAFGARPDPGRRADGHRHGAARGPALRPAHRAARSRRATTARASSRIATRPRSTSSSSSRRRPRTVRREEHRRERASCRRRPRSPTRSSTRSAAA